MALDKFITLSKEYYGEQIAVPASKIRRYEEYTLYRGGSRRGIKCTRVIYISGKTELVRESVAEITEKINA